MVFILLVVVSVVSVVSDGSDLFLELMSVMWVSEFSSESFSASSSNEMVVLSFFEFSCTISMSLSLSELHFLLEGLKDGWNAVFCMVILSESLS